MGRISKLLNKGVTVSAILESMIKDQKITEIARNKAKYKDGDLEERLDEIESMEAINLEKLDYVNELASRDIKIQRKFLELLLYVDELDISDFNKMSTILTSAVILSKLEDHPEDLSVDYLYLISTAMISIPEEDYRMYGDVLTNRRISKIIYAKTTDENEQRDICYDIFDYCDENTYADMNKDEYGKAISDCAEIVKQYQVKKIEKTK